MAKSIVKNADNVFVADLGNIKLSDAQKNAITAGIQEIVMRELARVDGGGMLIDKISPKLGLATRGIWVASLDKFKDMSLNQIREQL